MPSVHSMPRRNAGNALRPYTPPTIERVAITKTETGSANPTEFMAIVGPTS